MFVGFICKDFDSTKKDLSKQQHAQTEGLLNADTLQTRETVRCCTPEKYCTVANRPVILESFKL